MVLSQVLDHKLVLPVDVSGQPLKHELLGAVDVSGQPLKHKLLGAVDPDETQPLDPRLVGADEDEAQDKDLFSVPGVFHSLWPTRSTRSMTQAEPGMARESAMTTSPLVPILAAALLWSHLHTPLEAVTSADGLPVQHISRPLLCQPSSQDQSSKPEHSKTSSSQVTPASDILLTYRICKCDRFQSLSLCLFTTILPIDCDPI